MRLFLLLPCLALAQMPQSMDYDGGYNLGFESGGWGNVESGMGGGMGDNWGNNGDSEEDKWDRMGMGWMVKAHKHRISLDGRGKVWRTQPVNPYLDVLKSKWIENPFKKHLAQEAASHMNQASMFGVNDFTFPGLPMGAIPGLGAMGMSGPWRRRRRRSHHSRPTA